MASVSETKKVLQEEKAKQNQERVRYEKAKTKKLGLKADTEEINLEIQASKYGIAEINLDTTKRQGDLALVRNQYYTELVPIKREEYAAKLTSATANKESAKGYAEIASAEVEALLGTTVSSVDLNSQSFGSLDQQPQLEKASTEKKKTTRRKKV